MRKRFTNWCPRPKKFKNLDLYGKKGLVDATVQMLTVVTLTNKFAIPFKNIG